MNFNGWKLIELKFPGCWFGQTGYSVLEDPYGVRGKFEVTRQASYKDNKMNMLKMALNRTQEFVDENFSIEYYDFIKKYCSILSLSNIERVKDLLQTTQKYIEEYSNLKSRILESTNEKKDSYLKNIEESFIKNLTDFYSFDIDNIECLKQIKDGK